MRTTAAATILCLATFVTGCQNVPKYKHAGGNYDAWKGYQDNHFKPKGRHRHAAIDLKAGTITVSKGREQKVLTVNPNTRIMHEDKDITLAQLPVNTAVKYSMSDDGTRLTTVWYGHSHDVHHPAAPKQAGDILRELIPAPNPPKAP